MNFERALSELTPMLLVGAKMTVYVSIVSIVIGIVVGLLACFMVRSRIPILRWIANIYIWIIRGTPMLVQAYLIYFAMPSVIRLAIPGFRLAETTASIITLSLNAGAYLAEIFRGGIAAVPKGQSEAARSLGLGSGRTMMKVVLPQAVKISIPSMVNQFIITVKDTSILSVIGLADLTNLTKQWVGATYQFFPGYVLLAVFYLAIISVLMIISKHIERKFSYERKN